MLQKKNSWAFTLGTNIIYPTVKEYREFQGDRDHIFFSDFVIKPKSSIGIFSQIAYNHVLFSNSSSQFSILSALGYKKITFYSSACGSYQGDFSSFNGTINLKQLRNYLIISMSLNSNIKTKSSILWVNQIGLESNLVERRKTIREILETKKNNTYISFDWYYLRLDYSYLFYQIGLMFPINKKYILSPSIRFSFLHINKFWEIKEQLFPELRNYQIFTVGLTFVLTK